MNPTKNDFDEVTIQAMNEIAILLRAAQEMFAMYTTFNRHPDLSVEDAKVDVRLLVEEVKNGAMSLLGELFAGSEKRQERLASIRMEVVNDLGWAIGCATELSEMEEAAYRGSMAEGNVIRQRVLEPIEQLCSFWRESHMAATEN